MDKKFDWTALAEGLENGEPQGQGIAKDAEFLWNASGKLGQKKTAPELDMNAIMAKMKTRIEAEESTEVIAPKKTYLQLRYLKYAASVAIIGMLSFVAYYISSDSQNSLAIEKNEQNLSEASKSLALSDGTQITLDKGAKLSYPPSFSETERIVRLKGSAFFDVARDESKPFSIEMEQAKVQVLGTSFQLTSDKESAKVDVKSGKVNFANKSGEKSFLLTVGQSATYNASTNELTKYMGYQNNDGDQARVEWQNDRIYFKHLPLSAIVNFMANWQGVSVTWENPNNEAMTQSRVTTFKTDASLTQMFGNILDGTGVQMEKNGNKIILK